MVSFSCENGLHERNCGVEHRYGCHTLLLVEQEPIDEFKIDSGQQEIFYSLFPGAERYLINSKNKTRKDINRIYSNPFVSNMFK